MEVMMIYKFLLIFFSGILSICSSYAELNFLVLEKLDDFKNNNSSNNLNFSGLINDSNIDELFAELLKNDFPLSRLASLDLSFCDLSRIPNDIEKLTSLLNLNLNSNHLTEFPVSITKLTSLQKLHLNYNNFQSLPKEIGNLKSLKVLDLASNKLEIIPNDIGKLAILQELNIDNNRLAILPKTIEALTSLTKLYVGQNYLTYLPEEMLSRNNLLIDGINDNWIAYHPKTTTLPVNDIKVATAEKEILSALKEMEASHPLYEIINTHSSNTLSAVSPDLSSAYERELGSTQSDHYKHATKEIIISILRENEYFSRTLDSKESTNKKIWRPQDCFLARDQQAINDIIKYIIGAKKIDYEVFSSKNISSPLKVICINYERSGLYPLLTAFDTSPTSYDLYRYKFGPPRSLSSGTSSSTTSILSTVSSSSLVSSSSYTSSSSDSKDNSTLIAFNNFINERDVDICKSNIPSECIHRNIIRNSIMGLLNKTPPVKLSITNKMLLINLKNALEKIKRINPNTEFSLLNRYYNWIFDLIAGILSVSVPPIYNEAHFDGLVKELYTERFPGLGKKIANRSIQNANFMVRSGMDALVHALKGCSDLSSNQIALPIGKDIRACERLKPNANSRESVYYEYTQLGIKDLCTENSASSFSELGTLPQMELASANTLVLGLTSQTKVVLEQNSKEVADQIQIIASMINEKTNRKNEIINKNENKFTVILDITIEDDSTEKLINTLINLLSPMVESGRINLILVKSLQKQATLGTGKTKGGILSIFSKANDLTFDKCVENINDRTKDYPAFRNGVEGQFLMNSINSHMIKMKDDMAIARIENENAKLLEEIYSSSSNGDRKNDQISLDAPVRNGPFLFFPKVGASPLKDCNIGSVKYAFTFGLMETSKCGIERVVRVSAGVETPVNLYERFYVNKIVIPVLRKYGMLSEAYGSNVKDVTNALNLITSKMINECKQLSNNLSKNSFTNAKMASIVNFYMDIVVNEIITEAKNNFCKRPDVTPATSLPSFIMNTIKGSEQLALNCNFISNKNGGVVSNLANHNYQSLLKMVTSYKKGMIKNCQDIVDSNYKKEIDDKLHMLVNFVDEMREHLKVTPLSSICGNSSSSASSTSSSSFTLLKAIQSSTTTSSSSSSLSSSSLSSP